MTIATALSPAHADDAGSSSAALLERTDAIAEEVARARGLSVKRTIKRAAIASTKVRERLVARLSAQSSEAERADRQLALERWGLVRHGTSIHEVLLDVLTEQIAGFYDAGDATLYIAERDGGDAPTPDALMAHEIVHALQDQHFGLAELTGGKHEADERLARQALVEGDGVVTAAEVMLAREGVAPPWGMDDAVTMMQKTIEAGGGEAAATALARAPLVVRDLLLFPYARGLRFVAELRAGHAWRTVDDVYRRPPRSTEQVLHLDRYLADDAPVRVTIAAPAALKGWRVAHQTVWGEAGLSVLLRQHGVDVDRAAIATAGWGGDRAVTYVPAASERAGAACAVAVTVWDEEVDAVEFEEAVVHAVEAMVAGAVIEASDGRTVWLGADARAAVVERRGDRVAIVIGAPLASAPSIAGDVLDHARSKP